MSELIQYKCPGCGGSVTFDSGLQKMKCPYCDAEFEIESLREYDEVLSQDSGDDMTWDTSAGGEWNDNETEGMKVYVCSSCGGEIVCDDTVSAAVCPYCDSPVVMKGNFAGDLRPDLVIPFKYDKKAAINAYENHIRGKKLLPKQFRDKNHIDEIKGLYVPFWLFDADVNANVRYKATTVRMWQDGSNQYTMTNYYSVIRGGTVSFANVPVDGSSLMPDELMQSIEPFDISEAVDFSTAYLSGYLADRYDVTADDSVEIANGRIKTSTENSFMNTVSGYQTVIPESSSISLSNGKARYALYPVWILNTTYEGNRYTFAMNGQTGRMVGDLPMDRKAYRRTFATFFAIGTAVAFAAATILSIL